MGADGANAGHEDTGMGMIWEAYVRRVQGPLPYKVIINGQWWGLFRKERQAVRYIRAITGIAFDGVLMELFRD